MKSAINREEALKLLKKYNKESFHLQHALTLEAVMAYFAKELGYEEEEEYWKTVGLLHDIDYEMFPEEHCKKAVTLLSEAGVKEDMISSICSHAYGLCSDIEPKHEMEKVLYAVDELTGLIWSASLLRPSKSVQDMELKSLKKKFKDKGFASGCSREIIKDGANRLAWDLDTLLEKTLKAMQASEENIAQAMEKIRMEK